MCNLCSINHFADDEWGDEFDESVSTVCVHGANRQGVSHQTSHQDNHAKHDLSEQLFYQNAFVSAGSSF